MSPIVRAAHKAHLLIHLLRRNGFPAWPVLVSTSDNANYLPLPAPDFDHLIVCCLVDDGGTNYEGGLSCVDSQLEYLAAATAPVNGVFYSETDQKSLDVNVHREVRVQADLGERPLLVRPRAHPRVLLGRGGTRRLRLHPPHPARPARPGHPRVPEAVGDVRGGDGVQPRVRASPAPPTDG